MDYGLSYLCHMNTHYTENICFFDLFITWNPKNFNAIRVLPLISEEWIFVCNYMGGFKKQSNKFFCFVRIGLLFPQKNTGAHVNEKISSTHVC